MKIFEVLLYIRPKFRKLFLQNSRILFVFYCRIGITLTESKQMTITMITSQHDNSAIIVDLAKILYIDAQRQQQLFKQNKKDLPSKLTLVLQGSRNHADLISKKSQTKHAPHRKKTGQMPEPT